MKKQLLILATVTVVPFAAIHAEEGAKAEAKKPNLEARFKKFDADKDGNLTKEEFAKGRDPEKTGKQFARIDKDKDGKVTLEEFSVGMAPREPKAKKPAAE